MKRGRSQKAKAGTDNHGGLVSEDITQAKRASAWRFAPWAAVALGVLCMAPSLLNGFAYDDVLIIECNPRIRSLQDLGTVWTTDWWLKEETQARAMHAARDRLYRPLSMTSFALNYAVHGLQPFGYHLVNVALHGLACWLVWLLSRRVTGDDVVAGVAAILFAVHPVHVEAVANCVGRAEVLSALFMLLGLLALAPRDRVVGWSRVVLAAVSFFAALAAKESAICYAPIAVGLVWCRPLQTARTWRWWAGRLAVLAVPGVLYLAMRYHVLGGSLVRPLPPHELVNPLVRADFVGQAVGVLTILGHYARLMVFPRMLSSDYGMRVVTAEHSPSGMALLGIATVLVCLVVLARGFSKQPQRRLAAVLVLAIAASYALISNVLIHIGVTVAERLMYWPSVPICLLIAAMVVGGWRRLRDSSAGARMSPRLVPLAATCLVLALGGWSAMRSTVWRSNDDLFLSDVRVFPQNARLNYAAGRTYLSMSSLAQTPDERANALNQAREYFETALRLYPRYPGALIGLGLVAEAAGDHELAERCVLAGRQFGYLDPDGSRALSYVRKEKSLSQQRIDELQAEVDAAPDVVAPRVELARLQLDVGEWIDALANAEKSVELAPDDLAALRVLADALICDNQAPRAAETLRHIVELAPDDWKMRTNLAVQLAIAGLPDAVKHAKIACELKPDSPEPHVNLAEVYYRQGELDAAVRKYEFVLKGLASDSVLRPAIEDQLDRIRREREAK